jgi:undecaprenyl diphosphate synthase
MNPAPAPFLSSSFAAQSERARGLHVAIAMDGNGRWAEARGLPRTSGHAAGVEAVRRVVAAAPALGIGTLTLFAFSSDNWRRSRGETAGIFAAVGDYLRGDVSLLAGRGVRTRVIGRRDRLPRTLVAAIEAAERATAAGRAMRLQIALDYSGRDAILAAVERCAGWTLARDEFTRELDAGGDVDLFVRSGGERRLSDFMLWECAYAELVFTGTFWPDFDGGALSAAVAEFHARGRRFGGLDVHASRRCT